MSDIIPFILVTDAYCAWINASERSPLIQLLLPTTLEGPWGQEHWVPDQPCSQSQWLNAQLGLKSTSCLPGSGSSTFVLKYGVIIQRWKYNKANRSGDDCHWKDHLLHFLRGEACRPMEGYTGGHQSLRQKGGSSCGPEPGLWFLWKGRGKAGWTGSGLAGLNSCNGLLGIGTAPNYLVAGPWGYLFRAGD